MNVLIIGEGGREHALAWKLSQSSRVDRVFVAPGNAGTALDAENVDIAATDIGRLIKFAQQNQVRLTVVGPETPLVQGLVDAFGEAKLRVFGPRKAAAELEGSKVFCKNLLRHADVPTADYQVFRNADHASTFLKDREDVPVVVKADGLAAGKGVFVCPTRAEAIEAVKRIGRNREFGDAGNQIVIEERLDGQEASVLAITDGRTILTLPPAQDHKRAFDQDAGPNTGGMGRLPCAAGDGRNAAPYRRASARPHRACARARSASVSGGALCRRHDHQPRAESAGIQRPLRRPRVPAPADAAAATWPMCSKPRSRADWTN